MEKKIARALLSVYHKEGLAEIVEALHGLGVELVSTGGTHTFIQGMGIPCRSVEEITQFPEMLGGRVKTLHPGVMAGILARRNEPEDLARMTELALPLFDLVVVDLYPFEETRKLGASEADIIEKIDIGGIALIRAAAKNYRDVVIVPSRREYGALLTLLQEQEGVSTLEERRWFARQAFATSSHYDSAIFDYFDNGQHTAFRCALDDMRALRYGENPHQEAFFFGDLEHYFDKVQGKELSYNNLQDIAAAVDLIAEFEEPTFAILKHTNPCGVATRSTLVEAYQAAYASDTESPFGGILVANRSIDAATAAAIGDLFFEVLIAPDFDSDALASLTKKSKRILLIQKESCAMPYSFRSALGGVLMQAADTPRDSSDEYRVVTQRDPSKEEKRDLLFAEKVAKHCKSNAIALVKNGQVLATGVGQTSRIAALDQAIAKAQRFGFSLQGAVLASDAFFPFSDCVESAAKAGITAIIQPGGSIRDEDSVVAADHWGIAMVMTGYRHFRH